MQHSKNIRDIFIPEDTLSALGGETACRFAAELIELSYAEDGEDLTGQGIFSQEEQASAYIIAKEDTYVVGLPLISLILSLGGMSPNSWKAEVQEGSFAPKGTVIARLHGSTVQLMKVERIILNIICHLSGVANMTKIYLKQLEGTGVRLLDTRKTIPGHRYLEKYAVRTAGGINHRINLSEMLMIKDNHIDAAGSITKAVKALRERYQPCPPIEVECRNYDEVQEAVFCKPERILLDNMDIETLAQILPTIPKDIEAEISGGVNLENIRGLALSSSTRPADFISVGRLTHSVKAADFSMRMERHIS